MNRPACWAFFTKSDSSPATNREKRVSMNPVLMGSHSCGMRRRSQQGRNLGRKWSGCARHEARFATRVKLNRYKPGIDGLTSRDEVDVFRGIAYYRVVKLCGYRRHP